MTSRSSPRSFGARFLGPALVLTLGGSALSQGPDLTVTATSPPRNAFAPRDTTVTVTFDRALDPSSLTSETFRVFGRASGAARGLRSLSADGKSATLEPERPFSAGEAVCVNLSRDLRGADGSSLRAGGFACSFTIRALPSSGQFDEIAVMSNRARPDEQTRIYGALAADLNDDGYVDLTTVNEVSADLRVFLNRADGSGLFHDYLPPVQIGVEASPSESADFDNDGHTDACAAATQSESVWIVLGNGDGTFRSSSEVVVGGVPHGIAVLDIDGDGDVDIANARNEAGDVALLANDGAGSFSPPVSLDGGVVGEYGLAAGDMNEDGLADIVVAGRDGQRIRSLLARGDGTFTAAPDQDSGGRTWVVVLGDIDLDGRLDATAANSGSGNGAALLGNGDGTFDAPVLAEVGYHTPSTDLGDLDGDGDLDWVLSSFGGGFWRVLRNDGAGSFTFERDIEAPANPSCAVLHDSDGDGDVDMALSDEIADVFVLLRNRNGTPGLFQRGDGNGSGATDISDAVRILLFLFGSSGQPTCPSALDADDSGIIEVTDAIRLLGFIFLDAGPLPPPQVCGPDPTPDPLACEAGACSP